MNTDPSIAPATAPEPTRRFVWPGLALALMLLLCVPAFHLPLGRDAANFVLLGREVALGARPYTDIWDNKPPGVFLLYALLARVSGSGETVPSALPVIIASLGALTATLLLLVNRFRSTTPNRFVMVVMIFATVLLLPLAMSYWMLGQAEVFALPLLTLAYLLGQRFAAQPRLAAALACGLTAGLLPLLKPQFMLAALLPLIAQAVTARRAGARTTHLLLLAAGLVVPGLLALLWLAAVGSLADAWDAVVLFNLHYRSSGVGLKIFFYTLLNHDPLKALALLGLAVGSAAMLLRRRTAGERAAAWWWLGSLLAVAAAGRYWLYHWLIVIPATLELARLLWLRAAARQARMTRWLTVTVVLLLTLPAGLTPLKDWHAYLNYLAYTSHFGLDQINSRDPRRLATLGEMLRRQLSGTDRRIQFLGYDGDLYLLAGARPATRFFYDFPLYELPPDSALGQRLRATFLDELAGRPPALIVVGRHDANPVEFHSSEEQLATWPELQALLRANYRVAEEGYDLIVLKRLE